MGNRRMGAQRLNALLKKGSTQTDSIYQAGSGAEDMIASHNIRKDGRLIVTEISIDLAGKNSASIRSGGTADDAVGANGEGGAFLMLWEDDVHGQFVMADVIVTEVVNGSDTAMSISSGTAVENSDDAVAGRADVIAGFAVNATGISTSRDMDGATADTAALADGEYVYLTTDAGNTTTFTQGRMILRLVGVDNSWTL